MIIYYKFRAFLVTWAMRLLPRKLPFVFKGGGSSLQLCQQIKVLGYQRVVIVTDEYLGSCGILDPITSLLEADQVDYSIYAGILPDPTYDKVAEALAVAQQHNAQAVLAVGGGSVMDAAKMVAMLSTNPGEMAGFTGLQPFKKAGLPLLSIPTTAGTGSEITLAAVISDPVTHDKQVVADSKMISSYVALDWEVMKSMPPSITAATGVDALTHAVESYLARSATESTDMSARAAIKLTFKYLTRAYHDGEDMEARDAMASAAFYAGEAFSMTSVGYVHAVAHQLGRYCGTPHGNANAMVLPEVLTAYGDCVHGRLAQLAQLVGLGVEGASEQQLAEQFIAAIAGMRDEMHMPVKPRGLKTSDIKKIVSGAIAEAGEFFPVPRYLRRAEITVLVENLLE